MASVPDGVYWVSFTGEQLLSPLGSGGNPGMPTVLLPPTGEPGLQQWQVQRTDNGTSTIRNLRTGMYLGFDGDPDQYEMARLYPEPREWQLTAGGEPNTFTIGVPDTDMRLGLSLLRIWPPHLALMPSLGDEYQAWTFRSVE